MEVLIAGLVLFFAVHSISIVNEPWRDRVVTRIGQPAWQGLFALASLAGLVLVIWGYGLARAQPVVLYLPPAGLRHVTLLLMIPVFPLLFATYLPGRIQSAAKHPMLLATKLWASAHMLANGSLADVLLFGGFLAWAVADRISMKRRNQGPIPSAPPHKRNDAIAVIGGLLVYVIFVFWAHSWLIGVTPLAQPG